MFDFGMYKLITWDVVLQLRKSHKSEDKAVSDPYDSFNSAKYNQVSDKVVSSCSARPAHKERSSNVT